MKIRSSTPSTSPCLRIHLLPGERTRDFVLSVDQEQAYLAAAPYPLKDAAVLMLDTGLRVGEALGLQWPDIHLTAPNGAKFGYLEVREGKSRSASRKLPLTDRVRSMLLRLPRVSAWLFTNERMDGPLSIHTLESQHRRTREALGLPVGFVLHSLRHTFGTKLGEEGVDIFTLMRIMGHSTVEMTKRYVHPTSKMMTRAFAKLEARNGRKLQKVSTVSTTLALAGERASATN